MDVVDTRQRGVALGADELHVEGVAVGLRDDFLAVDLQPLRRRDLLVVDRLEHREHRRGRRLGRLAIRLGEDLLAARGVSLRGQIEVAEQRLDAGVDARIVEDFRGHGRLLTEEDRVLQAIDRRHSRPRRPNPAQVAPGAGSEGQTC